MHPAVRRTGRSPAGQAGAIVDPPVVDADHAQVFYSLTSPGQPM